MKFDKYFEAKNKIGVSGPRFFIRTRLMNDYVKEFQGGLLDIGCGEGNYLSMLFEKFPERFSFTGLDASSKAIDFARDKLDGKASLIHSDIYSISKKFDVVVLGEVLEHIEEEERFLGKVFELVKEGGALVLSVPFDKSLWSECDSDAGHFRRYEKKDLFEKLERAGFAIEKHVVWGFPLMRLAYPVISKQNKEIVRKEKPWLVFASSILKNVFLFDNFFNSIDYGVGIIVLAKKPEAKA